MSVLRRIEWPLPVPAVAGILLVGAALLLGAILMRRKQAFPGANALANLTLFVAALWNAAIVFAFMSPYNRHVFHLGTHRSSVIVNAVIGIAWLATAVFSALRWYKPGREHE